MRCSVGRRHPRLGLACALALAAVAASGTLPTTASALVGQDEGAAWGDGGYGLNAGAGGRDGVLTVQLPTAEAARGFGLASTGSELLGRYGLTADEVLATLAPHLAGCRLDLRRTAGTGPVVHEYYELRYGSWPLVGARLHLHHSDNRLVMVRARLPDYRLPAQPPRADDFLPLAALGYPDLDVVGTPRRVIAESGGLPAPAWELAVRDGTGASDAVRELVIDAQTGALLATRSARFELARVYERGPQDGELTTVELPDLPGTGYLDGRYFAVYAPTPSDPRVQAPDNRFEYLPDDPADALSFDQVQSYYGATRALAWFARRFGYDQGGAITVHVNAEIDGRTEDAQYVPPPRGPKIMIGAGGATLTNLARDTDVIAHELSHHVIYTHLTSSDGESGVLHEGTADYFAYAMAGDPNLGESVVRGNARLRTAALPPELRWDTLPSGRGAHFRGQLWSAVLWTIRAQLGEQADRLVYDSLAYLGPESGIADALLALVSADRDLSPLPAESPEAGLYGRGKCAILGAAVERGFATYVEELDGASCGLDLAALADESRRLARAKPAGEDGLGYGNRPGTKLRMFGRTCAAVGATSGGREALALLILLAAPLAVAVLARRPQACRQRSRRRHGP